MPHPGERLHAYPPVSAFESEDGKQQFHLAATSYLKHLAKLLGLSATGYTVRSNKAGPAIAGEVTLHGEWLYIQLGDMALQFGMLVRSVASRKDYSGGPNQWIPWQDLADIPAVAERIRRLIRKPEGV